MLSLRVRARRLEDMQMVAAVPDDLNAVLAADFVLAYIRVTWLLLFLKKKFQSA